jgi:type IV pilus assembly protein PilE
MIAVAIIGLLAVVAGPAFMDQIRKGRRSEAFSVLAKLQQEQERWRSTNATYADGSQLASGLKITTPTATGYYAIAITSADAVSYVATATAVSGLSQASDSGCTLLAVRMLNGNLAYGSGSGSTPDWTDPKRCWAR